MILNDLNNKENIYRVIVSELKYCGVKFRRDKNAKSSKEQISNRIFSVSLDLLELKEVKINGGNVTIPKFVQDACNFVIANINTEGLFRKAGSTTRQKQIKAGLEMGHKLGKQHHVIDVANILKSFFRDLPEALIPPGNIQDTMLKCLITTEKKVDNLLLTCLLLPLLTLNTLAYFMQFLNKISEYASTNKMTIENLSIIFAPGLMPLNHMSEERLNGHVRVISLLIENASKIGVIPEHLLKKARSITDDTDSKNRITSKSKRKIRRSGSLTRMFNGLRKIVGGIGSNENLNNISPESSVLPCINKSIKKRSLETPVFSAKKKKNILAMQQQPESLTSTPVIKKSKLRLSLDIKGKSINNRINMKNQTECLTSRCSLIESPINLNQEYNFFKLNSMSTTRPSLPCIDRNEDINRSFSNEIIVQPQFDELSRSNIQNESHMSNYIKLPVENYIEIEERVISLEKQISEEFKCLSNYGSICLGNDSIDTSGPERVQNKFEQTLENIETLNENSLSGQLANHLKQELRIRNKNDPVILRSPSARKIGTIRRRSRELITTAKSRKLTNIKQNEIFPEDITNKIAKLSTNSKINLIRGKPNTITTGLTQSLPFTKKIDVMPTNNFIIENVICSDITPQYRNSLTNVYLNNCTKYCTTSSLTTPIKTHTIEIGTQSGDMQSHKKKKKSSSKPCMRSSLLTKKFNLQLNECDGTNSINLFPEIVEQTGRASIARIRVQNAGMVLEKAKLFNGM